jgi:probable poly-beta-1,6-N-acetyl-D-glucosamine export protein
VEVKKEKIESLKYMRVTAMLLVVLIHVTGGALGKLSQDEPLYFFYLLLNRFTRFEGAVFVFLSGLLLFYNYASRPYTKKTWLNFYKKRFLYILAPFFVWSIFYEWYAVYIGLRTFEGIGPIVKSILTGKSFYQLYFILILVQLYFLLPLFIGLMHKFQWFKKYLPLIGIAIEVIVQTIMKQNDLHFGFPLFTGYIASFFLGGWVGIYYPILKKKWSKRRLWPAILFTALLGLIYTALYYYQNITGIADIPYILFKLLAVVYFLTACYVLFKVSIWLEHHGSARLNHWAEHLRIYSFGFYLVHPLFLNIWQQILVPETMTQYHIFILIRYIAVLLSCYLLIRAVHLLFPRAWMLFGKLPQK